MSAELRFQHCCEPGNTCGRTATRILSTLPLLLASLLLGTLAATAQGQRSMEELHRLHQDPTAYAAMLEDPERDAYQKPHEVVTALKLKVGDVVADIGAGSGYFAFRLAQHVGEQGRVYAVDISPDMIRYMNRRNRDLGLKNLFTVLSDPDDPLLPNASVNLIFLCEVWHHIENQDKYLAEIRRILKPGGRVAMIDFQKKELPVGPPAEMKIAREDLLRQMQAGGFQLVQEHTFLPYQYFLVFVLK
ncbi:MAG: methyltransferase domain-containing protein [Acidobacteria bacterium]|nr:methyltransferase domain-containing protein [Acidobacteriota bacterium]